MSLDPSRLETACQEVRRRVLAGTGDARGYLSENPDFAAPDSAAELVLAEYHARRDRGEDVDPYDMLGRHPELYAALRRRFEGLNLLTDGDRSGEATVVTVGAALAGPPGDVLGRLVLRDRIGKGGMGVVYRGYDPLLGRECAVKVTHAGTRARPDQVARFLREASAAARLDHPNILPVWAFGTYKGEPALAMPLIDGTTLTAALPRFAADAAAALDLLVVLARAVGHAHRRGVVHRDLKPSNVLIDGAGKAYVCDFGLARYDGDAELTQTGQFLGTVAYCPPELTRGGEGRPLPAGDVWSLGVIAYEMLTGRRPFPQKDRDVAFAAIRDADPPLPESHRPGLDPRLSAVVLHCLEKNPLSRYPDAGALADDLERIKAGAAIEAPAPAPVVRAIRRGFRRLRVKSALGLTAAVAAFAAVLALAAERPDLPDTPEKRREAESVRQAEFARRVNDELRNGRAVTLLGPKGLPKWYDSGNETDRPPLKAKPEGGVSISSFTRTHARLLPMVSVPRYRVRAKAKFSGGVSGRFGVFTHHQFWSHPDGPGDYAAVVSLSVVEPGRPRTELRTLYMRAGGGASSSAAAPMGYVLPDVMPVAEGLADGLVPAVGRALVASRLRYLAKAGRERSFSVEVHPEGVCYAIDGVTRCVVPKARLARADADAWELTDKPPRLVTPAVSAGGGLGLYVSGCTATFSDVVVEPLTAPSPMLP